MDAQDELATAQQELKDARADLKAVQATSSASPSSSDSSSESAEPKVKATLHPMPPDETVNRVKQAQTELDAAQAGIGDERRWRRRPSSSTRRRSRSRCPG